MSRAIIMIALFVAPAIWNVSGICLNWIVSNLFSSPEAGCMPFVVIVVVSVMLYINRRYGRS